MVFASPHRRSTTCSNSRHARVKCHHTTASWKKRGQKTIDQDRVREIQTALIREHYLDGEPSGLWDQKTKAAIMRYQADQGWQTKRLPDARALIKLGLGPSHETAIAVGVPTGESSAGLNTNGLPQE